MAKGRSQRQTASNENTSNAGEGADNEERDFASDVNGDGSPEGFRRINPLDGPRLYFKAAPKASIQGVLLGRFKRLDGDDADEDKFYYQIRLTAECAALTDAEKNDVEGKIGDVVHLDERTGLRDLEPLTAMKKPQEVKVTSVEKLKLKRSAGSFWRWNVYGREAPVGVLAKLAKIAAEQAAEDEAAGSFD